MNFKTGRLSTALFLIITCLSGFSQDYKVKNFNTQDGICHPFVYTLNQDSKGFLWIGTGEGLCRFDGTNFTGASLPDSLAGQVAISSFRDSEGNLLFGLNSGILIRYNGKSFEIVTAGPDVKSAITGIAALGKEYYLISTLNNGLFILDKDLQKGQKTEGILETMITAMNLEDKKVILGSPDGLSVYEIETSKKSAKLLNSVKEIEFSKIQDIQKSQDGKSWWIATEDRGAFRLKLNENIYSFMPVGKEFHLESENFQSVYEDSEHNLWLSSLLNGVYKLTGLDQDGKYSTMDHMKKSNGLPGNSIKKVFEDVEGNIWIATYGEGLVQMLNQAFSFYSFPIPGIENNITAVTQFKGTLWIGGSGTLAKTIPGSKIKNVLYSQSQGLPADRITALSGYRDNLYIGTESNGLYVLNSNTGAIRKISYSDNSLGNIVQAFAIHDETLYMATRDGIYMLDVNTGKKSHYSTLNGLPHNDVKDVFIDKDNRLLFATRTNGIYQLNKKDEVSIAYHAGRIEQEFNSLVQDGSGNIWASTYGDGIYLFTPDTVYNFTTNDGLKSNFCYGLISSGNHSVWIGHRMGISRINTENYMVQVFDISKGITGDCNFNALSRNESGVLFFGTTDGLITYDQSMEKASRTPPYTNITRLLISDKEYDFTRDIVLPYSLYKLRIEFLGLSYSDPASVRYQYKLEGHDLEWSEITNLNFAVYSRVEDGDYSFLVRSFDSKGNSQETPAVIHIRVKLPIWKTWWFIALSALAILLAVFTIIKYREKKQKEMQVYLETELAARTKQVVEQKEVIELKNRDITDSITYAQRIQTSILPPIKRLQSNFSGCFAFYQPRDIVSGDFYWFDKVTENKFIIVCADSTGHGVPGAFMSMIGTTLIKDICFREAGRSPSQILKVLDHELGNTLNQNLEDGTKPPDGMDIIVCEIDLKTSYMRYAAAMRPLIVYKNGEQIYLKGSHSSVGGVYEMDVKTFDDEGIQLSKGDILYMFSDGYPDQFGGSLGKKFKMVRLKNMLADIYQKSMEEQYIHVKNTFNLWRENYDQVDDVLFMGIKI